MEEGREGGGTRESDREREINERKRVIIGLWRDLKFGGPEQDFYFTYKLFGIIWLRNNDQDSENIGKRQDLNYYYKNPIFAPHARKGYNKS